MVAASKLRRAQAAAEAARPYAERMEQGAGLDRLGRCRQRFRRPSCSAGTGERQSASAGGLHRRARPVRPVQFLDRAAGARARQCADGARQGGQNPLRRPQGRTISCAACMAGRSSRRSNCAACKQLGFEQAEMIAEEDHRRCSMTAPSTSARCSSRASVGDRADPDRAADHSAGVRKGGRRRRRRRLRIRAGGGGNPRRAAAAQSVGAGVPRAAWKTPPPNRARA